MWVWCVMHLLWTLQLSPTLALVSYTKLLWIWPNGVQLMEQIALGPVGRNEVAWNLVILNSRALWHLP